jgi:phosphatidylinositol glycan class P protein
MKSLGTKDLTSGLAYPHLSRPFHRQIEFQLLSSNATMAPQSRGRAPVAPLRSFSLGSPVTPDEPTPRAVRAPNPLLTNSSTDADEEKEEDDGVRSLYSMDGIESNEDTDSDPDDGEDGEDIAEQTPFLHHSNSSFLMANAFAPPYYNRPPTPLPASPSLTSLLRPSFSTTTSRPTTPDSSENDTPNDTEAAVAKSARTATTVPRASPKVPTYEYYGFVLYLLSSGAFCE